MPPASGTLSLHHADGTEQDLSVVKPTEGPPGVDISGLLAKGGLRHATTRVSSTPRSCSSEITYIDGDAGILRYRGYPIDQLAEQSSFLEVSYLLIYGELPTADAAGRVHRQDQAAHAAARGPQAASSTASRATRTRCRCCPRRSARCRRSTRTASTRSTRSRSRSPRSGCWPSCRRIASYAYKKSIGQPFLYPDNSLGFVENFLRMTFGVPAEPYEVDPVIGQARWTCCSSCTPTTSRTARPPPCGWSARPRPTCSPRSRPASTRCPARCTAARTRRCCEMLARIRGRRRRRRRVRADG